MEWSVKKKRKKAPTICHGGEGRSSGGVSRILNKKKEKGQRILTAAPDSVLVLRGRRREEAVLICARRRKKEKGQPSGLRPVIHRREGEIRENSTGNARTEKKTL